MKKKKEKRLNDLWESRRRIRAENERLPIIRSEYIVSETLYSISVYVTRWYIIYHDDHDYRNEVRTMQRN